MTIQRIAHVTVVVSDYDEAIRFYTEKLGFTLVEDTRLSSDKRWVLVAAGNGCQILLAKAANADQQKHVGNQTGGRVFLFLYTNSFDEDFATYVSKGVELIREPIIESYGKVAVFADLYGNLIDLIEPVG